MARPEHCSAADCPRRGGYGQDHAFCRWHADVFTTRAAEAMNTRQPEPSAVRVHTGPPVMLSCGHEVSAGQVAVGWREGWTCQRAECRPAR